MDNAFADLAVDYRMDTKGRIFARFIGSREQEVTCQKTKAWVLQERPEISLPLNNKG